MALVLADRVQETTSTTGTGTLTLSGAVTGYQSFAAIGNGNTTYYTISSGSNWEVGIGTYTSSGTTLSRDTVLSSSAGGTTKISVASGASVFGSYPAAIATPQDITSYTTTVTAAGTTTLTVSSTFQQFFTGTSAQTVQLPVTSTLSLGWTYWITNNSTGNVTVNSSGGNLVYTALPNTTVMCTCIDITVATAAGWDAGVMEWGTSTGSGAVAMATSPTLTNTTLAAGTTALAPLDLTAGTNLNTAMAGAMEYDGTVPYFTPFGTSRGVIPAEQLLVLNANYTLTSQTAAQKLFNASTNGAVTLAVGTYIFECVYRLTSLAGASSSFGFALVAGTAVIGSQAWVSMANKPNTAVSLAVAPQLTFSTAANTAIVTGTNNTIGWAHIRGVVKITTGGTITPSVSLGTAAAAVVNANSYFKIYPVSATANAKITVGNWS